MITSPQALASGTDMTFRPAFFAFCTEALVGCRPTTTSTPLSFRFRACAWPCEP